MKKIGACLISLRNYKVDAEYLLRDEVFQELYERRRHIMSAAGKPMKQVMIGKQKRLVRDRSCIETTGSILKERFQLA